MSSILPTTGTPPAVGPTQQQIDALINKELQSQSTGPNATEFQSVDKLNISQQARNALMDAMARQELTVAQGAQGKLTGAQSHFIFNGNVYNAIKSFADGQGSLASVKSAIEARGQRIDEVMSQVQGGTPPVNNTPPTPDTSAAG